MEYRILGPLEARVDGEALPLGGPRQRGVLVCLLAQAGSVVPTPSIVDDLWPDAPPATASNLVQGYVSRLRKALGQDAIETRGVGYVLHAERIDVREFERLMDTGTRALQNGDAERASVALASALKLWRGPALADLADEPFLQPVAGRLEELKLLAHERLIEAELARGRHAEVVDAAQTLVRAHPLRERPRALLMTALYRSGRQADALAAYRAGRELFAGELGIEPSRELQELERQILRQDPELEQAPPALREPAVRRGWRQTIIVAALDQSGIDSLIAVAEPLARESQCELILATTVPAADDLPTATSLLRERSSTLLSAGIGARAAAFTSLMPGADLARIADEQEADFLLVDAPDRLLEDARLIALLDGAPCDTGVLVGGPLGSGSIAVPFTGADHDWAAIELGAWLARATSANLAVMGTAAADGRRDASRLLANASLAVERALGVPADPVLVEPAKDALVEATAGSAIVVAGLTERWRREGLGSTRAALAAQTDRPTIFVKRGLRPGPLAPPGVETRFTWTINPGS